MLHILKVAASVILLSMIAIFSQAQARERSDDLERVIQELVPPPFLPAHEQVAQGKPKIIQIRMIIEEKLIDINDGATIQAMMFNGTVPGPLIVVHQNDYVELTLVNPKTNTLLKF